MVYIIVVVRHLTAKTHKRQGTPDEQDRRASHLSLALQARRDANVWAAAAREDGWQMNDDQLEECREYAADYRRIARDHLADARLANPRELGRPHSHHGWPLFLLCSASYDVDEDARTR